MRVHMYGALILCTSDSVLRLSIQTHGLGDWSLHNPEGVVTMSPISQMKKLGSEKLHEIF